MLPWIIAFVAIDLAVTVLVVRRLLARRAAVLTLAADSRAPAALPSFGRLREFTAAMHPRIGEIVRANWSGDADALPTVLTQALDEVEHESRNFGLALDRDILKKLVEASLAQGGVTAGSQLREALKKVA